MACSLRFVVTYGPDKDPLKEGRPLIQTIDWVPGAQRAGPRPGFTRSLMFGYLWRETSVCSGLCLKWGDQLKCTQVQAGELSG